MKSFYLYVLLSLCLILYVYNPTLAQQTKQAPSQDFTVKLYVTVTTYYGRPIGGFGKENFSIYENKTPLEITSFTLEEQPASYVVLFDLSESAINFSLGARNEVLKIMQQSHDKNEYVLIGFNTKAFSLTDWGSNDEALVKGLNDLGDPKITGKEKGASMRGTAFFDACYIAIEKFKSAPHPNKVLLIISDGQDTSSKHKKGEIERLLKESNVTVYGVGIYQRGSAIIADVLAIENLESVAEATGGAIYFPEYTPAGFPSLRPKFKDDEYEWRYTNPFEKIRKLIQSRYAITFKPANQNNDGKWHKIEIKVTKPANIKDKIDVNSIKGYFASDIKADN